MRLDIARDLLDDNDAIAAQTAELLRAKGVLCVGLLSSPGAGKTSLLERTAKAWSDPLRMAVIVGDVATEADADRLRRLGVPAIQINTLHYGASCHLEAGAVARAVGVLDLSATEVLFVENVGNLVCPVAFRLGEHRRAVLLSTAEGLDKPLKYPKAVLETDLAVITKTDLAPYVDVTAEMLTHAVRQLRPAMPVIALSAKTGDGLDAWLAWLGREREALVNGRVARVATP